MMAPVPRLAGGTGWNPTPRRAAFAKAPNPGQAGKGSVEEQPWEDFQGSISLFFRGSSAWLALSGVTGLEARQLDKVVKRRLGLTGFDRICEFIIFSELD